VNILFVHNNYTSRGGEDETVEDEIRLMKVEGHSVDLFSASNKSLKDMNIIQRAVSPVWSSASQLRLEEYLNEHQVDLVHVHNCFGVLSPAIFYTLDRLNVPSVLTLHNYRLLCANAQLSRNGDVCEACVESPVPWRAVAYNCYPKGRASNVSLAAMIGLHKFLGTWQSKVDQFVALTEFGKKIFVRGGIPRERLSVVPTYLNEDPGVGSGSGGYALFAGQHIEAKGIRVLLEAWSKGGSSLPPLKIVGEGPLTKEVEAAASKGLVQYLGRVTRDHLIELQKDAVFTIVPSLWYEGTPRVIAESFAVGTPVVASNLGAMKTMIDDSRSGMLFETGSAAALVQTVSRLCSDTAQVKAMRAFCREEYLARYTSQEHLKGLLGVYDKAIQGRLRLSS
jgi:glycosyltransferase involved in cell wall biosynthesis